MLKDFAEQCYRLSLELWKKGYIKETARRHFQQEAQWLSPTEPQHDWLLLISQENYIQIIYNFGQLWYIVFDWIKLLYIV